VHSVKDKKWQKPSQINAHKREEKKRLPGGKRKSYLIFDSEEVCHGFSQGAIAD
jgi:hypothetical protein